MPVDFPDWWIFKFGKVEKTAQHVFPSLATLNSFVRLGISPSVGAFNQYWMGCLTMFSIFMWYTITQQTIKWYLGKSLHPLPPPFNIHQSLKNKTHHLTIFRKLRFVYHTLKPFFVLPLFATRFATCTWVFELFSWRPEFPLNWHKCSAREIYLTHLFRWNPWRRCPTYGKDVVSFCYLCFCNLFIPFWVTNNDVGLNMCSGAYLVLAGHFKGTWVCIWLYTISSYILP